MRIRAGWINSSFRPSRASLRRAITPKRGRTLTRLASMQGETAAWHSPMRWTGRTALPVACKYARENGGVALAYALDGKDGIACIDLDHCVGADGKRSALANEVLSKCGKTYIESSVSGKGIHVFGKTDGMDLRSFSKDGDMEFQPFYRYDGRRRGILQS